MKKIILGTALMLSSLATAQIDLSSTRYGITVGGNYSRVSNAHNPSGPRYTFQAGILAEIPIDDSYQFYLQPEVVYYGAGETGHEKGKKGAGYNGIYANSYVSVPLYFKGYFSEADSEFYGLIGPRFNFLVNQKVKNPSKPYYVAEQLDAYPNLNGKANPFNFAIGIGLGYSYKRQLDLSFRYDLGLSNTYKGLMSEDAQDPNTSKKKSEQVLSLTLSYIFE